MTLEQVKEQLVGTWRSLAVEVRPSKQPDGSIKPFYLTRRFTYEAGDRFELAVANFADPNGKVAICNIDIAGHMTWPGEHPIAAGAQKVDFTADEAYAVTPHVPPFVDILNKVASAGYAPWAVGVKQSIFGKSFAPFGLVAGTHFKEYDLTYLAHGLVFWGARNVDGRGFDSEANRPTNLQIPMQRG